jgi:hypothetical protein
VRSGQLRKRTVTPTPDRLSCCVLFAVPRRSSPLLPLSSRLNSTDKTQIRCSHAPPAVCGVSEQFTTTDECGTCLGAGGHALAGACSSCSWFDWRRRQQRRLWRANDRSAAATAGTRCIAGIRTEATATNGSARWRCLRFQYWLQLWLWFWWRGCAATSLPESAGAAATRRLLPIAAFQFQRNDVDERSSAATAAAATVDSGLHSNTAAVAAAAPVVATAADALCFPSGVGTAVLWLPSERQLLPQPRRRWVAFARPSACRCIVPFHDRWHGRGRHILDALAAAARYADAVRADRAGAAAEERRRDERDAAESARRTAQDGRGTRNGATEETGGRTVSFGHPPSA